MKLKLIIWMSLVLPMVIHHTLTLSAELDAALKRLKFRQLRYMNGFIKAVLNLTLINAISKSEEEIQLGETSLTA